MATHLVRHPVQKAAAPGLAGARTPRARVSLVRSADSAEANRPCSEPQNVLRIPRCETCATLLAPQTSKCSSCGSVELESVCCSGAGSIVSWKVLHDTALGGCGEPAPFTIAIVELDDGPWVYSRIEDPFPERTEAPVRVEFRFTPPADRFPVFGVCAA